MCLRSDLLSICASLLLVCIDYALCLDHWVENFEMQLLPVLKDIYDLLKGFLDRNGDVFPLRKLYLTGKVIHARQGCMRTLHQVWLETFIWAFRLCKRLLCIDTICLGVWIVIIQSCLTAFSRFRRLLGCQIFASLSSFDGRHFHWRCFLRIFVHRHDIDL